MTEVDIWGDLPSPKPLRTPKQVLEEQAALLGDKTNNLLECKCGFSTAHEYVNGRITVHLPTKGFQTLLFEFHYNILELYPVTVLAKYNVDADHMSCENETELLHYLNWCLSRDVYRNLLASLIRYANEE